MDKENEDMEISQDLDQDMYEQIELDDLDLQDESKLEDEDLDPNY